MDLFWELHALPWAFVVSLKQGEHTYMRLKSLRHGATKDLPPEQVSVTADSTFIKSVTELGWRWAEGD